VLDLHCVSAPSTSGGTADTNGISLVCIEKAWIRQAFGNAAFYPTIERFQKAL